MTAALAFLALALPATTNAQEPDLNARIDTVKSIITGFDESAEACVTAVEQSPSVDVRENCAGFLERIDGNFLADYLAHCNVLTAWRDQFVIEAVANPDQSGSDEAFKRLVDVEYVCGEDALRKRTQYLFTAFDLTRLPQYSNSLTAERILNQHRFEEGLYRQRNTLLDSFNQQRQRLENETQRQWDRAEREVIRQQIDNSVDYGAFNH